MISGTAAAVLALQSPFHDDNSATGAIVSNSSSAETAGGTVSNKNGKNDFFPSSTAAACEDALSGAASSPQGSPTSLNSPCAPCARSISKQRPCASKYYPMRYSDGAPIIAGTAAAQMEAIATATAARITSITNDEHLEYGVGCDVVNAVASLGPMSGAGEILSRSHGFNTAGGGETYSSPYWNSTMSTNTISRTMGASKSNALSWVDHNRHSVPMGNSRVTPLEHDRASPEGFQNDHQVSLVSCTAQHAVRSTPATAAAATGGGMDILAEIICHAPPMSVPQAQAKSPQVQSNTSSYPQHYNSATSSIPSYQEIYQQDYQQGASSQQAQHHQVAQHQAQHYPQAVSQSPCNNNARVSSIPSYQEIYREMGLSPQQQQQQHVDSQRHANSHYNSASYSVEEVQVDAHTNANSCGNNSKRTMSHHYTSRATTHFGHAQRSPDTNERIDEGKELYTRKDLVTLGGHLPEGKDVHGNMRDGCDSLIVGSLEKDIRETDGLLWLLYTSDRSNGGAALCQSYHKKRPIRLFRSSLLSTGDRQNSKYTPPFLDVEDDLEEDSDVAYRYDGLYMVRAVWDMNGNETESFPTVALDGAWQTFFLTRIPKKPLQKEKYEAGLVYNTMGCQELWSTIQKMRGIKKPKKFEIPAPPVKLPSLRKSCVSGVWKDRKCAGFVRPVVEEEVKAPPQAGPKPPRSKSPRTTVPAENKPRRKQKQQKEEDVESHPVKESHAHEEEDEADEASDSDSSQQQLQISLSLVSSASAAKVLTPRPRLNSVTQPQPKKPQHDADSSDSETSTSVSQQKQIISPSKSLHSQLPKKRKPCPSPKMKSLLINKKQPDDAHNVSDAYFPKRASAARAEAANKEMLGGGSSRSYKRKSSESAPSAVTSAAVTKLSSRAASSRKRTKITHHDDSYSSSSSSEHPPSPPDTVDQSILTINSRILVIYKGSVFKATIRKRRFKKNKHDFLIHYDGNKKTNVHWVPLDRITEILEVFVDTPPKKQRGGNAAGGEKNKVGKKKKGGNKRKASVSRQESIESQSSLAVSEVENDNEPTGDSGTNSEVTMQRQTSLQQSHYNDEETESQSPPLKKAHPSTDIDKKMSQGTDQDDKVPLAAIETHSSDDGLQNGEKSSSSEVPAAIKDGHSSTVMEANFEKPSESSKSGNVKTPVSDETHADSIVQDDESDQKKESSEEPEPDSAVLDEEEETLDMEQLELPSLDDANVCVAQQLLREPSNNKESKITSSSTENNSNPNDPLLTLAMEAEADISADEGDNVESNAKHLQQESGDENRSGNNNAKQQQQPPARSGPTSDFKYPIGGHVYVEYRQIFYSSTILKARKKRSVKEYFVHYEGYKKSSNRWAKENTLHEVNALTTQRYDEQRFIPADILYESSQPCVDFSMVTRGKKATSESGGSGINGEPPSLHDITDHPASSTDPKKSPPHRMRSDASDAALQTLSSGVAFLAGSMVFVEWSGALYLAKMVKKRYSGNRTEYLISYDGFDRDHDAWVTVRKIYEVNPQTKRVFKRINSDLTGAPGNDGDKATTKRAPPGPKRRETRKKAHDDNEAASLSVSASNTVTSQIMSKTRKNGEHDKSHSHAHVYQRTSSRSTVQSTHSASASRTTTTTIHPLTTAMQGIDPGVEFLPGSTLFAEYKGGLCLAKMLKKRGKGDYMEYYIQYNGLKKQKGHEELESESEVWMSVDLVYEINPQTKRMFRQLSKK